MRQEKRQGYEQQHELAQELCAVMLQQSQGQQQEKHSSEKVCVSLFVADLVHLQCKNCVLVCDWWIQISQV